MGMRVVQKQEERMKVNEPERGRIFKREKNGCQGRYMGFEVEDLAKQ